MESQTVKLPDGWEPFEQFKKILAEKGKARVYFCSVPCSGWPRQRDTWKLRRWQEEVQAGTQLVMIEEREYDSRGEHTHLKPAIKVTLFSQEAFAQMWWDLCKISNSSCGCSLFINDGQGTDVRVMGTDQISADELRI